MPLSPQNQGPEGQPSIVLICCPCRRGMSYPGKLDLCVQGGDYGRSQSPEGRHSCHQCWASDGPYLQWQTSPRTEAGGFLYLYWIQVQLETTTSLAPAGWWSNQQRALPRDPFTQGDGWQPTHQDCRGEPWLQSLALQLTLDRAGRSPKPIALPHNVYQTGQTSDEGYISPILDLARHCKARPTPQKMVSGEPDG